MATTATTLTFLGGAGTVTGSKYLIQNQGEQLLLECGLFQGLKALRLRNWAAPAFDPRALKAVVLSHAHLDHTGYLPLLVRRGYRGPVHCTAATADLMAIILRDSAKIQMEDAARANRHGYSRHQPALPLYTLDDVEQALELVRPQRFDQTFEVGTTAAGLFRRAGHILGAATVELHLGPGRGTRLVFSGDLGRWDRPILKDPAMVADADVLLLESTYGDRHHATNTDEQLANVISETAHRGGVVVVPAFAVGRTQELVFRLRQLQLERKLPLLSVYLDSPMANGVTELYLRHTDEHDLDMRALMDAQLNPLKSPDLHVVETPEQSKALNAHQAPMIIIAGSGMATGGRVLHHLEYRLDDHRNTVLLTGYQAAGTRGRALQDGARELKLHGRMVPVRAQVATIDGLSAHADQSELLRWLGGFKRPPKRTYLVHGEPQAAAGLEAAIHKRLGWFTTIAADGATVTLEAR